MILSENDISILRTFPNFGSLSDQEVFDGMNAPSSISNPVPQGSIPKPFTSSGLTLAVDVSRRAGLAPFLGDLAPLVLAQNVALIDAWTEELVLIGVLEQADHDAIDSVMAETILDPSYQSEIEGPSWAFTNLGAYADKWWVLPDNSKQNFVPLEAISEAR